MRYRTPGLVERLIEEQEKPPALRATAKQIAAEFGVSYYTITDWRKRLNTPEKIAEWKEKIGAGHGVPEALKQEEPVPEDEEGKGSQSDQVEWMLERLREEAETNKGAAAVQALKTLNDLLSQHTLEKRGGPVFPASREQRVRWAGEVLDCLSRDEAMEAVAATHPQIVGKPGKGRLGSGGTFQTEEAKKPPGAEAYEGDVEEQPELDEESVHPEPS